MSVFVYIWVPNMGSIANYLTYQLGAKQLVKKYLDMTLNVGHVSLQISDDEGGESIYVSHRPHPDSGEGFSSDIQGQLADLTEISYEDDKKERGKPTDNFELKYLNEKLMIQHYKQETIKDGKFYTYHGVANNCAKVAFNLIRIGLQCDLKAEDYSSFGDGTCLFCRPHQYSTRNLVLAAIKKSLDHDDKRESKVERRFVELRRARLIKEANAEEFINSNRSKWITKKQAVDALQQHLDAYLERLDDKGKRRLAAKMDIISMPSSRSDLEEITTDVKDLMECGARLNHILKYLDQKVSHMWTPSIIRNFVKNIETSELQTCYRKEKPRKHIKLGSIKDIVEEIDFDTKVQTSLFVFGAAVAGIMWLNERIRGRNEK